MPMTDQATQGGSSAMGVARDAARDGESGRKSVYRTIVLLGVSWLLVTSAVMASLVYFSAVTARQMQPLQQHIAFYNGLYALQMEIADLTLNGAAQDPERERIVDLLREVAGDRAALDPATRSALLQVAENLAAVSSADPETSPAETEALLAGARAGLRRVLQIELIAQGVLIEGLQEIEMRQLQASLAMVVMLVLTSGLIVVLFRRKVRAPLNDLTYLMGLLSKKDYASALTSRTDPLMRPVFVKYNQMVERLRRYDEEHLALQANLRGELKQTMRELVRQQRSLGRAERLAAAGDLAARVAHELRNPIAAVLMALGNLRQDVITDDKRERVDLMMRELQRIATLLSGLLEIGNMERESPTRLRLGAVAAEVVKLIRIQLEEDVVIALRAPDALVCRLPESSFRHALFDLLTNVAQTVSGGGRIEITLRAAGDELLIQSLSDGSGFPPSLLEAAAGDAVGLPGQGSGLGLALVRRFVQDQGGRLTLRNLDPRGAFSEIRIPLESCSG